MTVLKTCKGENIMQDESRFVTVQGRNVQEQSAHTDRDRRLCRSARIFDHSAALAVLCEDICGIGRDDRNARSKLFYLPVHCIADLGGDER